MEKDLDKLPGQISGGMQKRVGLARALALSPDILLFDEPTAGLDPITASEIDALILKMQKEGNMTSIVVTHDLPSARAISDRLALMRNGQILIEGSFQDLQASKDEFVVQFLNGFLGGRSISRAFRLGLFIVATLLILVAGVFLIGEKRFLFQADLSAGSGVRKRRRAQQRRRCARRGDSSGNCEIHLPAQRPEWKTDSRDGYGQLYQEHHPAKVRRNDQDRGSTGR